MLSKPERIAIVIKVLNRIIVVESTCLLLKKNCYHSQYFNMKANAVFFFTCDSDEDDE